MQDCRALFGEKRITILGLGLLGRGVGDAEFFAKCGAQIIVTDKKSAEELAPSIERLEKYPNIAFHLGEHLLEDFTDAELVVKAAGVPLNSPEIAAAKAAGVSVVMSTALFAKHAREEGATIVGITGTRGKSTVSHLIFHCLERAGKRAMLGGNIRGLSTLAMLPDVRPGDIAVLELDSWQLQGFGDLKISPQIAVFTNLMPDHQNYYPSMDEYFADKANIYRFQGKGDVLICGMSIKERIADPRAIVPDPIPSDWTLCIVGEHNRGNAALAAEVLRTLHLSEHEIRDGLESFEPVEGRLQFVREIDGVKIYNDNNATTPEATIAALRALGDEITLIIGGSEKGLPLEQLIEEVRHRVSHMIVLTHPKYLGSERLITTLKNAGVAFDTERDLASAMNRARDVATKTILFSPAFASFGMFQNEYERNDEFLRIVQEL